MRQATPDTTRNTRGTRGLAILAALILAGFLASPAQAGGSEFDDGFEDQLGRLVASEVFHLGKWVLAGGPTYVHHQVDYDHHRAKPRGHAHGRHKHHQRHHYGHRKHYSHRDHYWRRHRGHDHGYDAPCKVETYERVRRNRYGEVVEYEREERRSRDRYARW